MTDPTEATRRALKKKIDLQTEINRRLLVVEINVDPYSREGLEAVYGTVYDTAELQEHFTVEGFAAPVVVVTRKSDGRRGSLWFQHSPRFYWNFEPVS